MSNDVMSNGSPSADPPCRRSRWGWMASLCVALGQWTLSIRVRVAGVVRGGS